MSKKRPSPGPPASRRAQEAMDPERLRDEPAGVTGNARNHFEEDYPGPSQAGGPPQTERTPRRGGR